MANKNNAAIYDPNMLLQAGINPKTGLPIKMEGANPTALKSNICRNLTIMDEQNAINRYTWYNLPEGLTSQLMERILYYRGQGMLFKLQNKFYFLPYALDGTIDVYGRYTGVTPLPFNGTANDGDPEKPWIQGLNFKPMYEAPFVEDYVGMSPEELQNEIEKSCVLFWDYSPGLSQTIIPRANLHSSIIDVMSDCIPFMRTALLNGTGITGMRVPNENDVPEVKRASAAINNAALTGEKFVPIIGKQDFQEVTPGPLAKAEEYMLALQSLDNFRLSLYGLDNGGLFQKKSHMLEAEQEMNAGNTGLVAEDGLRNRQYGATIANTIWGTSIWVEPSESTIGIDRDGDMVAGDDGEAATARKAQIQQEETNE